MFLTDNTLNKVARTCADIVINSANVFTEQAHADKLGTDEHKQHGKKHEDPFRRPLRAKDQPQHHQQDGEREPRQRDDAAENAQQTQRRGGQAGDKVVHQVDETHKAVLRFPVLTLGMQDRDFRCLTGERISEDWNKRAALVAMQHGVDNMTAVGAQHAAVIAHRFTGRTLDKTVDSA